MERKIYYVQGFDYMDLGLAEMLRVYEATDMVTLGAIHVRGTRGRACMTDSSILFSLRCFAANFRGENLFPRFCRDLI